MTKLENVKNWQKSENKKKIWNLVVSKPENNNMKLKTAIDYESNISRKEKH